MGADTVTAAFALLAIQRSKPFSSVLTAPGSYVASDAIWRETIRAREAGSR